MAFHTSKGHELQYKKPPFAMRKAAFCNTLAVNMLREMHLNLQQRQETFGEAYRQTISKMCHLNHNAVTMRMI